MRRRALVDVPGFYSTTGLEGLDLAQLEAALVQVEGLEAGVSFVEVCTPPPPHPQRNLTESNGSRAGRGT